MVLWFTLVKAPSPPWCRLAAESSDNSAHSGKKSPSLLGPLPELAQPLAGAVEHLVEAVRLDLQVLADLLLGVVREIEADEELAVALVAQLAEQAPHLARLLL